ncbi:MAG TPA: DnaB-like helicase N-terminal domain-containing protein [Actinospica sp.]|jgi:replicative DNA helicase|nr:DnaB-like helicase N-terminal domain-containing protein [Actinospica sp.]
MSDLTTSTERALLGALLTDPAQLDDLRYVRVEDFEFQRHREIYTAIQDVHAAAPSLTGAAFADSVASRLPTIDFVWEIDELHALALNCPDPDHGPTYARMVQEAAFRRDLAEHAERIGAIASAGTEPEVISEHLALLSEALGTHATRFGPMAELAHISDVAAGRAAVEIDQTEPERLARQDQVLADLMRHPEDIREVSTWLGSDRFAAGPRREVYETIVYIDGLDEPVDEITVAWNLARRAAAYDALGTDQYGLQPYAGVPAYITTLRDMEVPQDAAFSVGRQLLADDLSAKLAATAERMAYSASREDVSPAYAIGSTASAVRQIQHAHEYRQDVERDYQPQRDTGRDVRYDGPTQNL